MRSSYTGQELETKRPDRLLPLSVRAIASKAGKEPKHRFRGLYSLLNRSNLRAAWFALNRKAAAGVDGITHEEYGRDLDAHVEKLAEELKGKHVKRAWHKWLNRRSRGSQLPWDLFVKLLERYPLPNPRIVHQYASANP